MYVVCFCRYLKRKAIDRYPDMAETMVAVMRLTESMPAALTAFGSSNNPLAAMAGIDRRNENRAAASLVRPENRPPVIVVPERDDPGIRAKH